ncbi:hypothetical protein DFH08DRAFT_968121 [Mycena albidolilacea]|uniref:MYND-type domain-containing protein n=1 Tax=Mycena albidolilacea TaxID=1033008 RepID=A0AAD6ZK83_9AGAR|nr:hypothetical protein DFH08DRAFT_968121 [Mycena albidolilacea]
MAGCVIYAVPESLRLRRLHPLTKVYGTLKGEPKVWAFVAVFGTMSRLTAVARCCNAVCTETSESSGTRLHYCAGCHVMRYYSSSCQKTARKYHKLTICADLRTLNTEMLPKVGDPVSNDEGVGAE